MNSYTFSIQDKTKQFAVRIVKACSQIETVSNTARILATQLLRSGTSVGANCHEAKSAQSRKDYLNKYEIALKEARETKYWIEVIIESGIINANKFNGLLEEIEEIIKILVSTTKKLKQ